MGTSADDPVVLLDAFGRGAGTHPKRSIHHERTPFHLAFSCHVVDASGRVLVTRRAAGKATWPATWTNACCGHPLPGETLRGAVTRRLAGELGLSPRRMGLALPDFVYRAEQAVGDGRTVVEHELCPVVVAEVGGEPTLDPDEVDDAEWMAWDALVARAAERPDTLSPWSVRQLARLCRLAPSPLAWLDGHASGDGALGLDDVLEGGPAAAGAAPAPAGDGRGDATDALIAVRTPVDDLLARFLAGRRREAEALDPAADQLGAEVRRLVAAGGKRLRPAFVYWGHRATGAPHDDRALAVAAAVELLHTFALVHDDVMDRSSRRRGDATAHVAFAARHRREGLAGDPDRFGVSAALLAGDLAFTWADQMLDGAGLAPAALARARAAFTQLRTEVIGGQYLDLRLAAAGHPADGGAGGGAGDDLAAEDAARQVALLKSARYTVTRPLRLGAALHDDDGDGRDGDGDGGDPRVGEALARYGDAVGLAFQMRDDVLGLFGDPEVTGKGRLDDLREGKRTVLVTRALALAPATDRKVLADALGDPALDEAAGARCREVVASSGALASVEALIAAQHALALHALDGLYEPARAALAQLAGLATRRWQ